MITNIRLGQDGRLGNQLFQVAAIMALAQKLNTTPVIPEYEEMVWHGQEAPLKNFDLVRVENRPTSKLIREIECQYNELDYMRYNEGFWSLPNNTNLNGYFQSTRYFDKLPKYAIQPKEQFLQEAEIVIRTLSEKVKKPIVSVHMRRGDNTDGSNPNQLLNKMYEPGGFYFSYLEKAAEYFEGFHKLIFTGGARFTPDNTKDVEWAKQTFGKDCTYSYDLIGSDYMLDFCLIGACDGNILSHVSSFGWWAAYLGDDKGKQIVAPLHYHPDMPDYTYREGFYPSNWITV